MRKKSILFVSDSKSALALYRSSVGSAGLRAQECRCCWRSSLRAAVCRGACLQGWMR